MEDNTQGKGQFKGNSNSKGNNDRNKTNDLSSFVFGKVQPQALSLEEAVLGALMLDKDALPRGIFLFRSTSIHL
jgi:replicative DNA helicase